MPVRRLPRGLPLWAPHRTLGLVRLGRPAIVRAAVCVGGHIQASPLVLAASPPFPRLARRGGLSREGDQHRGRTIDNCPTFVSFLRARVVRSGVGLRRCCPLIRRIALRRATLALALWGLCLRCDEQIFRRLADVVAILRSGALARIIGPRLPVLLYKCCQLSGRFFDGILRRQTRLPIFHARRAALARALVEVPLHVQHQGLEGLLPARAGADATKNPYHSPQLLRKAARTGIEKGRTKREVFRFAASSQVKSSQVKSVSSSPSTLTSTASFESIFDRLPVIGCLLFMW